MRTKRVTCDGCGRVLEHVEREHPKAATGQPPQTSDEMAAYAHVAGVGVMSASSGRSCHRLVPLAWDSEAGSALTADMCWPCVEDLHVHIKAAVEAWQAEARDWGAHDE